MALSEARITYSPPGTFSGTDSFVYTVSDGRGGSASATVSIDVGLLCIDSIIRMPPEHVRLHFWGVAQRNHIVEGGSSLAAFSPLGPATEQSPGSFTFEEAAPENAPAGFYRVREQQ